MGTNRQLIRKLRFPTSTLLEASPQQELSVNAPLAPADMGFHALHPAPRRFEWDVSVAIALSLAFHAVMFIAVLRPALPTRVAPVAANVVSVDLAASQPAFAAMPALPEPPRRRHREFVERQGIEGLPRRTWASRHRALASCLSEAGVAIRLLGHHLVALHWRRGRRVTARGSAAVRCRENHRTRLHRNIGRPGWRRMPTTTRRMRNPRITGCSPNTSRA